MFTDAPVLLILGFMFLIGLAADLIGRHSMVPRVTLLILGGPRYTGPAGFDVLPQFFVQVWFPPLTTLALSLVGFLLGHHLSISSLKAHGKLVLGITVGETTGAIVVVAALLLLIGVHPVVALLLAGVSAATAPAATFDIVRESGVERRVP